jgi:mRNA-degrading endonuclease RelE of RelBE toxin-antitoxin system
MTRLEIKAEISKILDELPEESLKYVLDLLKEIKTQPSKNIKLTGYIRKIMEEDKELLKKLAE